MDVDPGALALSAPHSSSGEAPDSGASLGPSVSVETCSLPPANALKGQQHVYSSPAVLAQVMAQDLPEVGGRVTMDRGRNAREDAGCFCAFNLLVSGFGIPLPHQLPVKLCFRLKTQVRRHPFPRTSQARSFPLPPCSLGTPVTPHQSHRIGTHLATCGMSSRHPSPCLLTWHPCAWRGPGLGQAPKTLSSTLQKTCLCPHPQN